MKQTAIRLEWMNKTFQYDKIVGIVGGRKLHPFGLIKFHGSENLWFYLVMNIKYRNFNISNKVLNYRKILKLKNVNVFQILVDKKLSIWTKLDRTVFSRNITTSCFLVFLHFFIKIICNFENNAKKNSRMLSEKDCSFKDCYTTRRLNE